MTGYGKKEILFPDKKLILEIKSLNSKNSDISIKIPYVYREKEMEIRQMIIEKLNRGKIDINFNVELNEGIISASINKEVVKSYYLQFKQLHSDLNLEVSENILDMIMRLPDTINADKTALNENEWTETKNALNLAIHEVDRFRKKEGKAIEEDLKNRINNISDLLTATGSFESQRMITIKGKLTSRLKELQSDIEFDHNRFEQELIYYLDKLDISEEKSRLAHHLEYFTETMRNEEMPGKKLGFIAQEMGREINTFGSKANDFNIQKMVVQMKDELEKIKEQLLNVL